MKSGKAWEFPGGSAGEGCGLVTAVAWVAVMGMVLIPGPAPEVPHAVGVAPPQKKVVRLGLVMVANTRHR